MTDAERFAMLEQLVLSDQMSMGAVDRLMRHQPDFAAWLRDRSKARLEAQIIRNLYGAEGQRQQRIEEDNSDDQGHKHQTANK